MSEANPAAGWEPSRAGSTWHGQQASRAPGGPDLWEVIGELEQARRGLFAAEREANAATRWWVLTPMLVLLGPLFLGIFSIAYPLIHGRSYWSLLVGAAVVAIVIAVQVWLGRKMLASRWAGLPQRRGLRNRINHLEHRLRAARASGDPGGARTGPGSDDLATELDQKRRALNRLESNIAGEYRRVHILFALAISAVMIMVAVVGVWLVLDTGRYALFALDVPLLVLSVWAWLRALRKFREPGIVLKPRRQQLKLEIKHLKGYSAAT